MSKRDNRYFEEISTVEWNGKTNKKQGTTNTYLQGSPVYGQDSLWVITREKLVMQGPSIESF